MNKVLKRQMKRLGLTEVEVPACAENWKKFLEAVSNFYQQTEEDRYLLERSLEISSREMKEKIDKNKEIGLQLAQASKLASLGTLASGVAHELNNPLQIIGGFAEILQDHASNNDPVVQKYTSKILSLVERMAGTTRHLLKLSRQESEGDITPVSLDVPIRETLDLMQRQFEYDCIEVKVEMAEKPCVCLVSSNRICGVFQNLLTNSRDAFLTNSVEGRKILIKTMLSENGDMVFIHYEDNAGGMPSEVLARIFDPFFTTKGVNQGTGLGLPLSRQTIEEFKGTMTAEVVGQSTIFHIQLPVYSSSEPSEKFFHGHWS